jgi:hypothetical protein
MRLLPILLLMFSCLAYGQELNNPNKLPPCPKDQSQKFDNCWGTYTYANGDKYVGEFKNWKKHGLGTYYHLADAGHKGEKYIGEFENDDFHGLGTYLWPEGHSHRGHFKKMKPDGKGVKKLKDGTMYQGVFTDWSEGVVIITKPNGAKYVGEIKADVPHGRGKKFLTNGSWFDGNYRDNNFEGPVIYFNSESGNYFEAIWKENKVLRSEKVTLTKLVDEKSLVYIPTEDEKLASNVAKPDIAAVDSKKIPHESATGANKVNLEVSHTPLTSDGDFLISINTNSDTASLKINGEEFGGRSDGKYSINRVARAGQDTKLEIVAKDVYGNSDTKTITVSRVIVESKVRYAPLNPAQVKRQIERDAVAIIIGISNYKTLPKAAHADDDARAFYDYAIRALGVKPENIKLLINQDAEEIEIYKTFKNWLPSKVRATTDVFVFYSGHGYTAPNGKGLYWFPIQGDSQLISKTAILVEELNADILAAKPKSVTIFADACYSGQARSGETLIADARPVFPKVEARLFPESFTVITASQYDQISSSSPELKHGIFSYYLMKGMEGDADTNKDGKITLGEMQTYLVENVGRQAGMMSRKQEPQLIGDISRVLIGR